MAAVPQGIKSVFQLKHGTSDQRVKRREDEEGEGEGGRRGKGRAEEGEEGRDELGEKTDSGLACLFFFSKLLVWGLLQAH